MSRNEALTSLKRRLDICEERGGGVDKVVAELEHYELPPPLFPEQAAGAALAAPAPRPRLGGSESTRPRRG